MNTSMIKTSFDLQFTQIAWVVKDINATKQFFGEVMGIGNFSEAEIIRLEEFDGTYYGEPCNGESLVSMAYSGGTFIELIQPLSGRSIFRDYLDNNPNGGMHHIAGSIPVAILDKVVSEMKNNGIPVISSVNHPIASIVFFDTTQQIGVCTEVMGITPVGENAVQKMKTGRI